MNIIQHIGNGVLTVALSIASLLGFSPEPTYLPQVPDAAEESVGRAVNPVATNNYFIAGSGISSSATTITLTSFTAPVSGAPYTMANFGDGANAKGYLTIEPGSRTRQEIVSFTGLTQNSDGTATLTGVTRGLLPFSPFTASSTYAIAHNGGSQVVVSNPPQLYDAIYSYIDNATTSGAVDGTTLIKGIYETATGQEAASTTGIGGGNTSATLALTTLISTSTAPASGNVIPVTRSDGNLDPNFFASAQYDFSLTASSTFTGATLPQPAYISASGTLIVTDNGATTSNKFDGFVITSTATGSLATIRTMGVVSGFSGLTPGALYRVGGSGTLTLATSSLDVQVGVAVSATEIFIEKKKRKASGTIVISTTNTSASFALGFKPSRITFEADWIDNADTTNTNFSGLKGTWDATYPASNVTSVPNALCYGYYRIEGSTSNVPRECRLYAGHTANYYEIWPTDITTNGFTMRFAEQGIVIDGGVLMWEAEE